LNNVTAKYSISDAVWEARLAKLGLPAEKDAIYKMVQGILASLDPVSAAMVKNGVDELDIVAEALDERKICGVGIRVNDEAISVSIARFAGGTVVGRSYGAFQSGVIEFILSNATLEQVEAEVHAALDNMQDGADWVRYQEGEDEPEDGVPAEVFGSSELRRAWQTLTNCSLRDEDQS
jgi:hypothetical protein